MDLHFKTVTSYFTEHSLQMASITQAFQKAFTLGSFTIEEGG